MLRFRLHAVAAALAAALLPAPGAGSPGEAEEARPSGPLLTLTLMLEGQDIAPEAWRAMTEGRTVWYRMDDEIWGRELYWPGGNRVTFQFADGRCLDAEWTFADRWYCFDFGGALGHEAAHCFRHLRHDGSLWALSAGGTPQAVDRIDETPLSCGPDVAS
ncbi:MAG: hypothetical protein AAF192_15530 [Pseudomonadota bacterium]